MKKLKEYFTSSTIDIESDNDFDYKIEISKRFSGSQNIIVNLSVHELYDLKTVIDRAVPKKLKYFLFGSEEAILAFRDVNPHEEGAIEMWLAVYRDSTEFNCYNMNSLDLSPMDKVNQYGNSIEVTEEQFLSFDI